MIGARERGRIYQQRLAEAKELGLWRAARNPEEAAALREELRRLGFHDWDGDTWPKMVATLREQRAALRGGSTPAEGGDASADIR